MHKRILYFKEQLEPLNRSYQQACEENKETKHITEFATDGCEMWLITR